MLFVPEISGGVVIIAKRFSKAVQPCKIYIFRGYPSMQIPDLEGSRPAE